VFRYRTKVRIFRQAVSCLEHRDGFAGADGLQSGGAPWRLRSRQPRHGNGPKATLSRRVAELERAVGIRLIERGANTLRLTEGRALHARTEGVLAEITEAGEAVKSGAATPRGRLRVGAPVVLAACRAQLPKPLVDADLDAGRLVHWGTENGAPVVFMGATKFAAPGQRQGPGISRRVGCGVSEQAVRRKRLGCGAAPSSSQARARQHQGCPLRLRLIPPDEF
jgi:DNA-binding transcriptional LysR family regulator